MKHTPGIWQINNEEGNIGAIEIQSKDDLNATLVLVYGRTKELRESNARLIAAAPELLEALESLTEEFADDIAVRIEGTVFQNQPNSIYHAIAKGKAAIAKAKGHAA